MPPLWNAERPLLLASTSRTRRALLEAAGIPVNTEAPGVDERALQAGWGAIAPALLARRLAEEKALAVSVRRPDRVVLGADQVLACDQEVFGKPAGPDEACRQLARLAGRTHALHAAATLAQGGRVLATLEEAAHLTMRALPEDAIRRYVALAGPAATRSVGCYEIEGLGIHLFAGVDGEHSAILGLPMLPLLAAFRAAGLVGL